MIRLSNKHKYSALRAMQLLLGFGYSAWSLFIKKEPKLIVLNSSLNLEFSDNSKALFEHLYASAEYREHVYFVINDAEKRAKLNQLYPNRFINNTELKNIKLILSAQYWFCSALELPIGGIFNKYQRTVYHLGHGMPYKRFGLIESKVSWYKKLYYAFMTSNISYSIATTQRFKPLIAAGYGLKPEQIKCLPQPKTAQLADAYQLKIIDKPLDGTHILYAPTWRPYSNVVIFPFSDLILDDLNEALKKKNTTIWLRVHPRFEQDIDASILAMSQIRLFSAKTYPEVNQYLKSFDALITDYSSLYFDFLITERPVLFFDYDLEEYDQKVGLVPNYQDFKANQSITTVPQFLAAITQINSGSFDCSEMRSINKITNYPIHEDDIISHFIKQVFH